MPKNKQIQVLERKIEEINAKMQQLGELQTYLATKLSRLKQEIS
jgi:prefoldin subunit 5